MPGSIHSSKGKGKEKEENWKVFVVVVVDNTENILLKLCDFTGDFM